MNNSDQTTHFGYQKVPVAEKTERVREVFNSVAARYDVMNDLMSFGVHRLWKRFAVTLSGVKNDQVVLDLAGGTGDLSQLFAQRVGEKGTVILADINSAMINIGRDRFIDAGIIHPIHYLQTNAESLPLPDQCIDCVSMGFGLRNVTDKNAVLREMYRVLKPGGRVIILEFSKPTSALLKTLYDCYSFSALPALGRWIADDADSYRYLAESIRMHPDQKTLCTMMEAAGLESCDYHNLSGGIVAIHRGFKF